MQQNIQDKVNAFIQEHHLLEGNPPLLLGFSGGPDSTALLLLLRPHWRRLTAVHLHHGLRGKAADADQAWSQQFCAARDISFASAKLEVPTNRQAGESVEMAARRLRLEFWRQRLAAEPRPAGVLAQGHHLDDLLETALLRFCRGSNSSGLTGLRPRNNVAGVPIIRPLLCLTRAEILDYLAAEGIADYCRDASNDEPVYLRNRIRLEIRPLLEKIAGSARGLYNTLEFLQADADFLNAAAEGVELDSLTVTTLRDLHPALLPRVIRRWLRRESGLELPFGQPAIERLREALKMSGKNPVLVDFHKDWFVRVTRDGLSLEPKAAAGLEHPVRWKWDNEPALELPQLELKLSARPVTAAELTPKDGNCEYFTAASLGEVLTVRPRQPGDRLRPFGAKSAKKLKKLVADAKLGPAAKRRLIVICNEADEILWAPGVRRAETGRVTPEDTEIVELRAQALNEGNHGID